MARLSTLSICLLLSLYYVKNSVYAFSSQQLLSLHRGRKYRQYYVVVFLSTGNNNNLVEAALPELIWEKFKRQEQRAVLNLSERESSPEEFLVERKDTSTWDQGQRWRETEQRLSNFLEDNSKQQQGDFLLNRCPQLYRLESDQVLKTAIWLVDEFSVHYVLQEPRLLLYKCSDVQYGLEFLSTMMMMSSPSFVTKSKAGLFPPALFLNGVDGGIQERAVKRSLGEAGDATYAAKREIAIDTAATLKALKRKNPRL